MLRALTRKTPPIGLDISTDGVRMMQLDAIGKAVSAIAAGHKPLPAAAADDPQGFREHVVKAVKDLLAERGFRGRRVVTCLGGGDIDIKQARLPRIAPRERASAIQWEANERFEFEVKPELLHHFVGGEVRAANEIRDEIIMLAAPEPKVDAHLDILDAIDLYPVAVDAEPACVFRPFERFLRRGADVEKVSVVVDIRPTNSWVIFAKGRNISFLKSVDVGNDHFSRAVAEQLSIDYAEAVGLRRQLLQDIGSPIDVAGGEQIRMALRDAIRPVAEELAREISLCLRYCAVTFRGIRPERVTLVGPGAADPYVQELLGESINLECEIGRPLRGIDLSQVELGEDHRGPLCEWSVVAGLALRDLLANQDRRERKNEPDRLPA